MCTPHLHTIHMAHMRTRFPFLHRDLTAARLTSLSLLNRETTIENVVLYNLNAFYLRKSYLNDITRMTLKPCPVQTG